MKTKCLILLPILSISFLSGCSLFEKDSDDIHTKEYQPVTGKFYLYEAADKRFTYTDTYFDINGSKGDFSLKYYENGTLKKEGKIVKLVTHEDYIGSWADDLHFNVKIGNKNEHVCTYTESFDPINQFRIIDEYTGNDRYYLYELPFVMGTYVREGASFKAENKNTNNPDLITPTIDNFTSAIDGKYQLDDGHYFYFLNPRGWTTKGGSFINSYYQYFSSSLSKPIEGFVSGHTFENESTLSFKTRRDTVDWGKGAEGRIVFGYNTFDEEDRMIDHYGTVDFSDGEMRSFTFEHLSRQWTDEEWNKFLNDLDYHLPDAILYDYIGGTYTRV